MVGGAALMPEGAAVVAAKRPKLDERVKVKPAPPPEAGKAKDASSSACTSGSGGGTPAVELSVGRGLGSLQ